MTSKQLCLKWSQFQSNILSAFESLQSTEDLADVTLTCEGINIKAHKFILSASSPYFRTIFKENPCPHPIVILNHVTHADLVAIIDFMYHGEVTVTEDQLSSFLQTAMVLQVLGLINNEYMTANKKSTSRKLNPFIESQVSPQKKVKMSPKHKKVALLPANPPEEMPIEMNKLSPGQSEMVEIEKIKTEDDSSSTEYVDNVEVVLEEKAEMQGSILEAALEVRDKPSSILERSLTAHSVKSPSTLPYQPDKILPLQDVLKTVFIPRKPPESEQEKHIPKSSSETSNPSSFEYPLEFLQQRIKTEDTSLESMSAEEQNAASKMAEQQPHHSSQCGNCPHCGKVYSNQSALKYHVRLVHSDLSNMYCCHLCPEAFDYREGYKKHMAEAHLIRN